MNKTYSIDQKRWAKLSIFEQMGNIYSEVGRSFKAKKDQDIKARDQATARAIDLFNSTTFGLVLKNSPKVKEVLRAKESYLELVFSDTNSEENIRKLDNYFRQFAIAARLNR